MQASEFIDPVEIGRRLGHDLARYGRMPGGQGWPASVLEGHAQALARREPRLAGDRYLRKWLQLRLGAYRRARVVDTSVTPDLLRSIDVDRCPVTRERLTHGELASTDWSVDRLNNDGAYARNNLAVMSSRANVAKGSRSYETVFALSQRDAATDGLEPVEWMRMAALMLGPRFATCPQLAPVIPLTAPIPKYSARGAMQQVQHVFTATASAQAGKNGLVKSFKPVCANERSRMRLGFLAEEVHTGLKGLEHRHDVWLRPSVMDAVLGWRGTLDEPRWALAGEISRRLAGARVVPQRRLQAWHIETRGHLA
ncbi:MAG: hypothetical protein H0W48_04535 [Methylibium sp.]|nr:hypothetical protein [Methylibium sp.]MBA3623713.1 hypothetical protein [Methylibium sp.]